jgi:hypothetical protein
VVLVLAQKLPVSTFVLMPKVESRPEFAQGHESGLRSDRTGPWTGRGPADDVVIRTPPPTIQAVQTRRTNCDHSWKSKISDQNLVLTYIVYFLCYGTIPGHGDTMLVADSRGHMCLRSSDMAKMDPNAADMAFVVWNGYVQDAIHIEDMQVSDTPSRGSPA